MPSSKKATGLATVHDLYLMQFQLMDHLKGGMRTPNQVKEAKKCFKQFKSLLGEADHRYMGGEDVLETLEEIQAEMSERLKARAVRSRAAKKAVKTITKTKRVK